MTFPADRSAFGLETIVAMLVGIGVAACSGRSSDDSEREQLSADSAEEGERPSALRIESGGGQCASNCWFAAEISLDGELLLEDETGAEHFSIARVELDAFWSVAGRSDMLDALRDPDDCYALSGYSRVISLTLSNGSALVDDTAMSCTASGSTHPYRLVYEQVLALTEVYLDCSLHADGKGLGVLCLTP